MVMIEANNLLVRHDDSEDSQVHGCFCTRYVDAVDSDTAACEAKKIVIEELNMQGIACSDEQLEIESTEQISEPPSLQSTLGKGFTFFVGA